MADAQPKNLQEAIAMIAELSEQLTNSKQTVAQLQADKTALKDENEATTARNAELSRQINLLQKTVGVTGGAGLPKEVQEDIQRRIGLGLNPVEATTSALRQHAHNERVKKQKETTGGAKDRSKP